ncbi:hypothetical protein OG552_12605 [Streptomyces sp. NBC_01476]|uniref:hypothetical protein n=1 Tax=Streptomyces sp. NBC_01476 TaxID=2903881 RepID=UPI002E2EDFB7|nr:hypothetical protein [Streptomyces sp. NBC_01476]
MGVYVSVRGWLECDDRQLVRIREIVDTRAAGRSYGGGWVFPPRQYNWTNWVFFGADVREQNVDGILTEMRLLARVPGADEEDPVTGLFLVSHETGGMHEWQVRDGAVVVAPAAPSHDYLDA